VQFNSNIVPIFPPIIFYKIEYIVQFFLKTKSLPWKQGKSRGKF